MVARLHLAQEKWFKKVTAAREKWLKNVANPRSLEAYVRGIADFLGVSPEVVRASLPARNWAEFQANASKFVDAFVSGVRRAYELKKWAENYKRAFTS